MMLSVLRYVARLNYRRALRCAALVIVGAGCASDARAATTEGVTERVLALVNAFRNEQSQTPLQPEVRLTSAAQTFVEYLAGTGRLDHDADGSTPRGRAKQRGYDGCIVGENIAYEYSSRGFAEEQLARAVVQGWKESPTHRENMVYPHFIETGVAVARGRDGAYYAVQMFGTPRIAGKRCPRVTN
jgi:uncharacterized protein YkwD